MMTLRQRLSLIIGAIIIGIIILLLVVFREKPQPEQVTEPDVVEVEETIPAPDYRLEDFEEELLLDYKLVPKIEGNAVSSAFSHIFAGGYAAGYYSYKWAEVMSADAFSLFNENGLFDSQTSHSFRTCFLESGGSEEPLDLFIKFRGRKPTIQALLEQSGISTC